MDRHTPLKRKTRFFRCAKKCPKQRCTLFWACACPTYRWSCKAAVLGRVLPAALQARETYLEKAAIVAALQKHVGLLARCL